MPSCPSAQCSLSLQDKFFNSVEELMTHANAARGSHPLCIECQRVFKDRPSYIQVSRIEFSHVVFCSDLGWHSIGISAQRYQAYDILRKMRQEISLADSLGPALPRIGCSSKVPAMQCRGKRQRCTCCGKSCHRSSSTTLIVCPVISLVIGLFALEAYGR